MVNRDEAGRDAEAMLHEAAGALQRLIDRLTRLRALPNLCRTDKRRLSRALKYCLMLKEPLRVVGATISDTQAEYEYLIGQGAGSQDAIDYRLNEIRGTIAEACTEIARVVAAIERIDVVIKQTELAASQYFDIPIKSTSEMIVASFEVVPHLTKDIRTQLRNASDE